jgi:ligand-binding sensor domain-containing protein
MNDDEATRLIADYSQQRKVVENLLAQNDIDHTALASAGEKLEAAQKAMEEYGKIKNMREANDAFNRMMQQVNKIIKFVITGEQDEGDGCASCSGSCDSCGGCH